MSDGTKVSTPTGWLFYSGHSDTPWAYVEQGTGPWQAPTWEDATAVAMGMSYEQAQASLEGRQ